MRIVHSVEGLKIMSFVLNQKVLLTEIERTYLTNKEGFVNSEIVRNRFGEGYYVVLVDSGAEYLVRVEDMEPVI